MDKEHWFAPMKKQADNGLDMMMLYLSTSQTTPFYVKIENNKKIVDSILVSKNNPVRYEIADLELMETADYDSVNVVLKKGLHVYGEKKFFANLRFSQTNHAEIITSKGRAALGTHFFVTYAPFRLYSSVLNYTVGVIATEDNTTVDIDGTSISLNEGESYIVEGYPRDNSFIGKEITSDKPISVTNGNFNGQYASTSTGDGSDILMDQTIPTERLGKEFILMSGNGGFSDGMESAIIVATVDNTEVYFNDETAPLVTLNKGQYYVMLSSKYKYKNANTSTAYVKTTENVYVFQLLSGSGSLDSGGFNYIPPLNCYLPKSIDEIGFVDQNPGYLGYTYLETHNTKLNIISQVGATVKLNGVVLNGTYGPYNVAGTTEWQTYTYPNAKGTIVIESTKAVTAGIAAGDSAVGYGGYFAGASSIPVITKSGECIPGVILEVEDTYDNYQWQRKNTVTGIFEDISGANSYTYTPTIPGEYICIIGTIACGTMITPSYIVLNCSTKTVISKTICQSFTITPKFSTSTQTINIAKTKIVSNGTKGSATIDANGDITYVPNAGFADGDTDSFSYYIEGDDIYPDSEIVTVNITLRKLNAYNAELYGCFENNTTEYNLTLADITTDADVTINYYENYSDAIANNTNNAIGTPSSYFTNLTKIYATIVSSLGCSVVVEISLKTYPVPNVDTSKYNGTICDTNLDGSEDIKFSDITPLIVTNPSDFIINYYLGSGTTPLPNDFSFTSTSTVRVVVESKNGCLPVTGEIIFQLGDKIDLNVVSSIEVCDNDLNDLEDIDLSDYASLFTSQASATYFDSYTNAQNNNGSISSNQTISSDKTYYFRFENTSQCPNIGELDFILKQPKKSETLVDVTICEDATIVLDAGSGFTSYLWSDGSTGQTSGELGIGEHSVELGFNGCVYTQIVTIYKAESPTITSITITGNSATVNVSGGTPTYYYSLDGIEWQESNVFTNLERGIHKVLVKDYYNCAPVWKEFLIINLINVITPNGDGYNDKLDYSDLRIKENVEMKIFDRYGKLIFENKGTNYIWDGTSAGRIVSTDSYWYILKWKEPDTDLIVEYSGWILVKNRN